jgi:hypothetical protein
MTKLITSLGITLSALAGDPQNARDKADAAAIKQVSAQNIAYHKLAAKARVAQGALNAFTERWRKQCALEGKVLGPAIPGDGHLDCMTPPPPQPAQKEAPK